ncbi:MAG: biotin/lipoyl-binding protein [Planctomycetaceae bacterium]|nr:biotin/lipoyl-binding protein [Planctomycetales bacterium]MCB9921646.1 biotin/lipoyl-binding protein [Planctomycetaceae bacterium]
MKRLRITVENKSYDVTVEDLTEADPYQLPVTPAPTSPTSNAPAQPVASATRPKPQLPVDSGAVTSPMAGSIKSVLVKPGDSVKQGQPLVVLEAMKMENQITAPVAGTVKSVDVTIGEAVQEGHVLVVLE